MVGYKNYFFELSKKTLIKSIYQNDSLYHNEYLSDIYDNLNNYSGEAYIVQTIIKSNNTKLSGVSTLNVTLSLLLKNKQKIITLNFAHPDITGQNIDYNNKLVIDAIVLSKHSSSTNNNLDNVIFRQNISTGSVPNSFKVFVNGGATKEAYDEEDLAVSVGETAWVEVFSGVDVPPPASIFTSVDMDAGGAGDVDGASVYGVYSAAAPV